MRERPNAALAGWSLFAAIGLGLLLGCGGGPAGKGAGLRARLDTAAWKAEMDSLSLYYTQRDPQRQQRLALRIYEGTKGTDSLARQQALALEAMAYVRFLQRSGDDSTLALVSEAQRIAEAANDSTTLGTVLLRVGDIQAARGDLVTAVGTTLRALKIREDLADTVGAARAMTRLSSLYWQRDTEKEEAMAVARRAIVYAEGRDSSAWCNAMTMLGLLMLNAGRPDSAVILDRLCIPLEQRFFSGRNQAVLYGNMGWAYGDLGKNDSAIWAFEKGAEAARRIDDHRGSVNNRMGVGEMLFQMGRYAEAGPHLDSALALAERYNLFVAQIDLHALITMQRENMGDARAALTHLRRREALNDSMLGARKQAAMNELRVRYETEKKDRENQQLRAAQEVTALRAERGRWIALGATLLALAVAGLSALLLQRNRYRAKRREADLEQQALRLQMDPHFLFNALNTIPGLYASGEAAHADDHVGHLSKFLRLVLETSRKRTIALSQELELTDNYLHICANRRSGNFTWSIHVSPEVHAERVAVPPMLVQPLVENALDHGLMGVERDGRVEITVDRKGDNVSIAVRDNGVGRKAAALRSPHRFGSSLGMDLVRDRIRMMDLERRGQEVLTVRDEHHPDGSVAGTTVTLLIRKLDLRNHVAQSLR